jgi:MFS family permease
MLVWQDRPVLYYCKTKLSTGSWFSYVFLSGPINDLLGRRWAGVAGVGILSVGVALQAGAVNLAMMIIGRIIAGAGTSIVSTSVPLYLSEISPARRRGAFIALNQVGIVFGYVCLLQQITDFFF